MYNKYYVLMKQCFYYSGEYTLPEQGGVPVNLFSSEEKAYDECDKLNISEFNLIIEDGSIREHGSSIFDLLSEETSNFDLEDKSGIFMKLFNKNAVDWWDHDCPKLVVKPTPQQMLHLINCFNFVFFYVKEVEKV